MKKITTLFTALICGGLFAQHIQEVDVSNLDIHFVQHSVASFEGDEGEVYVVAGTVTPGAVSGDSDILVLVANDSGGIVWSRYIDYGMDEFAGAVIVDFDNNIVLTGYTGTNGSRNKDLVVVKLDGEGNHLADARLTDGGQLDFGLYGLDIAQAEIGYVITGTGVDAATAISDKYAFVLSIRHDLHGLNWGRIYDSNNSLLPGPTNFDSFNHVLRVEHPLHGETLLLTGSGADASSNQMVVNDLIDPNNNGLSVWNTAHAQGNHEPGLYESRGVMALYHENNDEFFVLYYGSTNFPAYRKNIPALMTLDGTNGASSIQVALFNHNWGNQNNIFSGMEWSNEDQDEVVLSGYHMDAGNPPGDGYPLLIRHDLTTGSIWTRYGVGFDAADYVNLGFDFIVRPINAINPSSPYEANQTYYHPKALVRKIHEDPYYVFAAPLQEKTNQLFGLNLLNTGGNGAMPCSETIIGLDELASLNSPMNFASSPYPFELMESGAMVYNATLLNSLTCEEDGLPKPFPNTSSIKDNEIQIRAYPNPASNFLYLSGLANTTDPTIALYDLQGREVLSNNHQTGNEAQLDVSTLESGLYFLKVSEGGERVFVGRVILR